MRARRSLGWFHLGLTTQLAVDPCGLTTLRHLKVKFFNEKIVHLLHTAAIMRIPLQPQPDQFHRELRLAFRRRLNLEFLHKVGQGSIIGAPAEEATVVCAPSGQGTVAWPQRLCKPREESCSLLQSMTIPDGGSIRQAVCRSRDLPRPEGKCYDGHGPFVHRWSFLVAAKQGLGRAIGSSFAFDF